MNSFWSSIIRNRKLPGWRRRKEFLIGIILLCLVLSSCLPQGEPEEIQSSIVSMSMAAEGFTRADVSRPLIFPQDHGAHPDFQTEWWYYTGNLETDEGRHFGYQLTFFRRAIVPSQDLSDRDSQWAANQVYMAHFALTDVQAQEFYSYERLQRGAAGLAGAQVDPQFQVWLNDWRVEQLTADSYRMTAAQEDLALGLTLIDQKGPILQGDQGFSQKGSDPGNASHYYSFTRLETQGSIHIGETVFQVKGNSWMDHEFSTSALPENQIGWDWFALQLNDGSELMVFNLRQEDGSLDPFSSGTWIAPDGSSQHLENTDFSIRPTGTWKSSYSGGEYPSGWEIQVPSIGLFLEVEPYLVDQEHHLSFAYWEGAVDIHGDRNGNPLLGSGYVELTGYAQSMRGQF